MKTGILRGLVIASLLTTLLACSNRRAEQALPPASSARVTPPAVSVVPDPSATPQYQLDLPLEPQAGPPTVCKLGQSCMALDPRPFEPCLLSTKHCTDKVREPLLVDKPAQPVQPPAVIETSVEPPGDTAR